MRLLKRLAILLALTATTSCANQPGDFCDAYRPVISTAKERAGLTDTADVAVVSNEIYRKEHCKP